MIQRKKATIKIEIEKVSSKKVNIKISRYSTATLDMTPKERVECLKSEHFNCPNEPIFIEDLTQDILNFAVELFREKGVEEINSEKEVNIYKNLV